MALRVTSSRTPPVTRLDGGCALAVTHAVREDGSSASSGEAVLVVRQTAFGLQFDSDVKVGDPVPLGGTADTTYSFEAQPGLSEVLLLQMPLLESESDELYEKLKKKDEV